LSSIESLSYDCKGCKIQNTNGLLTTFTPAIKYINKKLLMKPSTTSRSGLVQNTRIRVWDLPTRLFHWALTICVFGAIITVNIGGLWMEWHIRFGMAALCLIVFRIIWGFVGSRYARFTQFIKGPKGVLAYLKNSNLNPPTAGHNAIGAWSVMLLLGVIGAQAFTGLFSTDDIMTQGPLNVYVSNATAETITSIHHLLSNAVIALIVVHIGAIIIYALRGKRLLPPMITGDVISTQLAPNTPSARDDFTLRLLALVLIVILAAGFTWLWVLGNAIPPSF
jgi:cytochrome b